MATRICDVYSPCRRVSLLLFFLSRSISPLSLIIPILLYPFYSSFLILFICILHLHTI